FARDLVERLRMPAGPPAFHAGGLPRVRQALRRQDARVERVMVISIETDTADGLREAVQSGLYAYNDQFAGPMDYSALMIGARDADKKIIGGLVAHVQSGWKWMHVHRLWVDESHRRAGIGRLLLEAAETEARKRGCLHVGVETFE